MDESLSWKIILIATIFSLFIMAIAYYFISPRESEFFTEEKMKKIAEFKFTHVSGRKEDKKVWEFYAEEGWTDSSREITHLYKVSDGKIYQNGKLVVTDLNAPRARAYRHSEIVEAFGLPEGEISGRSLLRAYIDLGKISKQKTEGHEEWSEMIADHLKYIPSEKRSEIEGNVELHKKDSSIYSQKINVNHEERMADISGDIKLARRDGNLRSDRMQYYSNEERLEAEGHVNLQIVEGGLKTRLRADRASFFIDIKKDMTVQGNLEVVQGKKLAVANQGTYSQREKEIFMMGKVKAIFEKAEVILQKKSVQDLKNPEAKKILEEKTILTSDELVFSTQTGDARASGSILVSQKGREAKAERAVYDDSKEILTLSGNVFMKKEKALPADRQEWVSAKEVVVSVKDETFEAIGAVEAEFKL